MATAAEARALESIDLLARRAHRRMCELPAGAATPADRATAIGARTLDNPRLPWERDTAIRGAADRLAAILMTSLVTGLGLLPLAVGMNAPGREIEGPMALVILGGLVTRWRSTSSCSRPSHCATGVSSPRARHSRCWMPTHEADGSRHAASGDGSGSREENRFGRPVTVN